MLQALAIYFPLGSFRFFNCQDPERTREGYQLCSKQPEDPAWFKAEGSMNLPGICRCPTRSCLPHGFSQTSTLVLVEDVYWSEEMYILSQQPSLATSGVSSEAHRYQFSKEKWTASFCCWVKWCGLLRSFCQRSRTTVNEIFPHGLKIICVTSSIN